MLIWRTDGVTVRKAVSLSSRKTLRSSYRNTDMITVGWNFVIIASSLSGKQCW